MKLSWSKHDVKKALGLVMKRLTHWKLYVQMTESTACNWKNVSNCRLVLKRIQRRTAPASAPALSQWKTDIRRLDKTHILTSEIWVSGAKYNQNSKDCALLLCLCNCHTFKAIQLQVLAPGAVKFSSKCTLFLSRKFNLGNLKLVEQFCEGNVTNWLYAHCVDGELRSTMRVTTKLCHVLALMAIFFHAVCCCRTDGYPSCTFEKYYIFITTLANTNLKWFRWQRVFLLQIRNRLTG